LEELLESFKSLKVYKKFRKKYYMNILLFSVTILKSLNDFYTLTKYLLLLNFVIIGVKIDATILKFLEIDNENLVDLNIKNTIIISSFIHKNNFSFLTDLGLVESLRERINLLAETETKILSANDLELINTVLERVYEKNKFYMLDNYDILSASSKCDGLIKETKKLLEGI